MSDEQAFKRRLEQLLRAADLGIVGFNIEDQPMDSVTKHVMANLLDDLSTQTKAPPERAAEIRDRLPEKLKKVFFLHETKTGTAPFPTTEESDGTDAYFSLLGPVLMALDIGGVLCIDELDSSLHPLLATEIVRLFNNETTNPNSAQLIFNTHDTNLLTCDLLRRDQIWFTEKDRDGCTHLYPLTDFQPRRDKNLQRGYLQGRFGAIPFIGRDEFQSVEADANAKTA